LTYFRGDGLGGDGGTYTYLYNDSGNTWYLQGDFQPGRAMLVANSSGLTLQDQTCFGPGNPLRECGPYWEWNGDNHEENVSELSAVLNTVPSSANVFTIYLHLPKYDLSGCAFNVSSTGCSYEGYGPAISGVWAFDAFGIDQNGNNVSSSIAVSAAEGTSGVLVGLGSATIVNGKYDAALSKNFNVQVPFFQNFTSNHKLTIETDHLSYLRVYVDNILEYSNNTLPVDLNGSSFAVNFYQFDNVNNMTMGTTWSNFTMYSSPYVTVSGLQNGMQVLVTGGNGFNVTALGNSSGVAVLDVGNQPLNLIVSVQLNGRTIVTYQTRVNTGAELKLVVT
jgi:hypothetical protein